MLDSVYKIIEVVGTSKTSWEDATKNAVKVAGEKEDFQVDAAKKSVIKPKAEKKVEAPVADADEADAPADDAAAGTLRDRRPADHLRWKCFTSIAIRFNLFCWMLLFLLK